MPLSVPGDLVHVPVNLCPGKQNRRCRPGAQAGYPWTGGLCAEPVVFQPLHPRLWPLKGTHIVGANSVGLSTRISYYLGEVGDPGQVARSPLLLVRHRVPFLPLQWQGAAVGMTPCVPAGPGGYAVLGGVGWSASCIAVSSTYMAVVVEAVTTASPWPPGQDNLLTGEPTGRIWCGMCSSWFLIDLT